MHSRRLFEILLPVLLVGCAVAAATNHAKDNGDIYITNFNTFDGEVDDISTTTEAPKPADYVDFEGIMHSCNESFITPMSYLANFNSSGTIPDENDKTTMCYFRCYFEKSGILNNFKLDPDMVRKYLWPATGDSISQCEAVQKDEANACVRVYAIMKCLMLRALTDARNKPMV